MQAAGRKKYILNVLDWEDFGVEEAGFELPLKITFS